MRLLPASLLGALLLGVLPATVAAEDVLSVPLDRSVKINLPQGAKRVMLGNAGVVDITVLDTKTAVLLGRTFGETNLLILDEQGRTLSDQVLMVSDSAHGRMTMITGPAHGGEVNSGAIVSNYACSPRCARYPMPGENSADQGPYTSAYDQYNSRAGGSRPAAAAAGGAAPGGAIGGALTAMAGVSQALGSAMSPSKSPVP